MITLNFYIQKMIGSTKFLKFGIAMTLLFFVLLTSTNKLIAQSPPTINLQDSIQKIVNNRKIPGLQVAVVSKDSILFQGCFGYADMEKKTPVTPKHLFKIGSVTKSFTALAIMSLVNQGKLRLDDELKIIAPEIVFKNKWEATHPVLIQHLLEHKTGFDDMHFNTFGKEAWSGITSLDMVEVYQQSLKCRWQPGLVFSYSNPNYVVLGHVIEKISKMPYQDYIAQYVLSPLRMDATLFQSELQNSQSSPVAIGYRLKEGVHERIKNKLSVGETAGALISPLEDMIHFVQFFLNEDLQNNSPNFGKETIQDMEKVHSWFEQENNIPYGYGYGLDNIDTEIDSVFFTGHSGGVWGFSAHFLYNKEYDLGITIANNGETSNRQIVSFLLSHFLKDKQVVPTKNATFNPKQVSTDWDGYYYPINERNGLFYFINWSFNTIQIEATADSLAVHYFMEGKENYTPYNNEHAFIGKNELIPNVYLTTANGEKSIYYYGDYYQPINGFALGLFKSIIGFALISGLLAAILALVQFIGSFFRPHWRQLSKLTFSVALPSLLFLLSIVLLVANSSLEGIIKMGQINTSTISIFLLTLLLPFTSLFGIGYLFKNKQFIPSKLLRTLFAITAFCGLFLAIYCIQHDWFAMQLWAY